jgi:hypothetical protein
MKKDLIHIFKCFKIQGDTYHDTHLMEQDSLLLQDQAGVMDTVVGDKWIALKKRGAL